MIYRRLESYGRLKKAVAVAATLSLTASPQGLFIFEVCAQGSRNRFLTANRGGVVQSGFVGNKLKVGSLEAPAALAAPGGMISSPSPVRPSHAFSARWGGRGGSPTALSLPIRVGKGGRGGSPLALSQPTGGGWGGAPRRPEALRLPAPLPGAGLLTLNLAINQAEPVQKRSGFAARVGALGRRILGVGAEPAREPSDPGIFYDNGATRNRMGQPDPIPSDGYRFADGMTNGLARAANSDGIPAELGQAIQIKELMHVLGDAAFGRIAPFDFSPNKRGNYKARGVGLEGFLYSKLEIERESGQDALLHQWDDFFSYFNALLAPVPWGRPLVTALGEIQNAPQDIGQKNARLNVFLTETVGRLQKIFLGIDPSRWDSMNVYMILARAYNRLKPGKNFFDSIDEEELARIRRVSGADVIWFLDIFEIGEIGRWGEAGGSPYSVRRYRVRDELGGDAAFKAFIQRAHAAGFRVGVDEIPNHGALDSDELLKKPKHSTHIIPPRQPREGEDIGEYAREIMSQVPHRDRNTYSPVFHLVKTYRYPGKKGKPYWILVHHPRNGDEMWIDMWQRDLTRLSARRWEIGQVRRLFRELEIDLIRRDMVSYVVKARYFDHWMGTLQAERDSVQGWARDTIDELMRGMRRRWEALNGAEFIGEMADAARAVAPHANFMDEAYSNTTDLSAAGTDFIYNKSNHDVSMGQIGLYDAMMAVVFEGDMHRLSQALDHLAYRSWQVGGARLASFVGTHDGGEGNPVDKFGPLFKAVVATALIHSATLHYNGLELGVGQEAMLEGNLAASQDRDKAIPFDVKVWIRWLLDALKRRLDNEAWVQTSVAFRGRNRALLTRGVMSRLEADMHDPTGDRGRIEAWTWGLADPATGRQKAVLIAPNYANWHQGSTFRFRPPILAAFGAFQPKADKKYILRDFGVPMPDGRPRIFERSGKELLEKGLFIGLNAGKVSLFEIEEVDLNAPPLGPPTTSREDQAPTLGRLAAVGQSLKNTVSPPWDSVSRRLNNFSLPAFALLQIPQILQNFWNLGLLWFLPAALTGRMLGHWGAAQAADLTNLPVDGYSFGMLADLLILPYFLSLKERAQARVQTFGILSNILVLAQLTLAGFMPGAAFFTIAPAALTGLVLSYLHAKGKVSEENWKWWIKGAGLFGLVMLAPAILDKFNLISSTWPVLAAGGAWAALLALDARKRLPEFLRRKWEKINWEKLSASIAILLFGFGAVAGLVLAFRHPEYIPGTSVLTGLLALAGNLFMLPRAVYAGNQKGGRLWFIGSFWAVMVGGWLGFFTRWYFGHWDGVYLAALTLSLGASFVYILKRNKQHFGYSSWKESLSFLFPSRR